MADLHVSVTRLEDFRKVVCTELPWATQERLIADIRERQPVGWQARWGTALHAAIEAHLSGFYPEGLWMAKPLVYAYRGKDEDVLWPEEHTVTWDVDLVEECAMHWPQPCVFEARLYSDWKTPHGNVCLSGKADAFAGTVIVEGKTRFGQCYPEDYANGLQWPCYLAAAPWARCVEYHVHEIGGVRDEDGLPVVSEDGVYLKEVHIWREWRQPGLMERVQEWVERFSDWVHANELQSFLIPKERKVA